jgi:hypothetical protein
MGGEQAADDARDQAGLPEVFVWHRLAIPELQRLIIACKVRIMEVQSAFSANGSRGRRDNQGESEDDYVIAVVDRDANIGLFRVMRDNKLWGPIETSANVDTIVGFMEGDAHKRGIHAAAVFELDGEKLTQVGNVVGGRYQESGGYKGNGRSPSTAKVRQDLEASFYYNERKIADAEEELRRPGISEEYRRELRAMIASSRSDMEYASSRLKQSGGHKRNASDGFRELMPPAMSPEVDRFIREFSELAAGVASERRLIYRVSRLGGGEPTLFVTFINLPSGRLGSGGGGAEAENNRMTFSLRFSDNAARVEMIVSALDRKYRLRSRAGTVPAIARYLADFLIKVASEVPPNFTHSR